MTNPTTYALNGQTRFEFDEFVAAPDTITVEYDSGAGAFVPVLPTEYTVEGVGVKGGVVIDYPNAPSSGNLRITLFASLARLTDFTSVGAITPEALNAEFDHTLVAAGNGNIDHENRITQNEADIATNQADIDAAEARLDAAEPTLADLDANAMRQSGGEWVGQGLPIGNLGAPAGGSYAARLSDVLAAAVTGLPDPTGLSRYALLTDGVGPTDFFWALVDKLAPLIDTLDLTKAGFNLNNPQVIQPPRTQANPYIQGLLAEELVNIDVRKGAAVSIVSSLQGAPDSYSGGTNDTVIVDDDPGSWAVYNDNQDLGVVTIETTIDPTATKILRRGNDAWRPAIHFRNADAQLTDAISSIKVYAKTGGVWSGALSTDNRPVGGWPTKEFILLSHISTIGDDLEGVRFELTTDTPLGAGWGNFAIGQVMLYHANGQLLANLSPSWRDMGSLDVPQLGARSRTTHSFVAADAATGFDAVYRMLVNGVSKARVVYDSAAAMTRWWNDVIGTSLRLKDTGGLNGASYHDGTTDHDLVHDGNQLAKVLVQLATGGGQIGSAHVGAASLTGGDMVASTIDSREIADDAIGSGELSLRTGSWTLSPAIPAGQNTSSFDLTAAPFNFTADMMPIAIGKGQFDWNTMVISFGRSINANGYADTLVLHRRGPGTGAARDVTVRLWWLQTEL